MQRQFILVFVFLNTDFSNEMTIISTTERKRYCKHDRILTIENYRQNAKLKTISSNEASIHFQKLCNIEYNVKCNVVMSFAARVVLHECQC